VSSLTYPEAVSKLVDAGFGKFNPASSPSTPELKDRVVGTNPPANQTTAITNEITIVVGSGPATRAVPDVTGQTVEQAQSNLRVYGFNNVTQNPVDNTAPAGEVLGTSPRAGTSVPLDSVIDLRVSKGNQFVMPDLRGLFYIDLLPQLQGLGFTGQLLRGGDVPAGDQNRNRVINQDPSPGTAVNYDGRITLSYGL
jgi:eukaryotic-like serine/threonine-protein kinase